MTDNANESLALPPMVFKPSKALVVICAYKDGDQWSAHVPRLPGAVGYGDTSEEALRDAKDAVYAIMETCKELGEPIPWADNVLCTEHMGDFDSARQATQVVEGWDGEPIPQTAPGR